MWIRTKLIHSNFHIFNDDNFMNKSFFFKFYRSETFIFNEVTDTTVKFLRLSEAFSDYYLMQIRQFISTWLATHEIENSKRAKFAAFSRIIILNLHVNYCHTSYTFDDLKDLSQLVLSSSKMKRNSSSNLRKST